jgi:hypothetical protein
VALPVKIKLIAHLTGLALSLLAAWEVKQKKKHFDRKFKSQLSSEGELIATVTQEIDGKTLRTDGKILKKSHGYYLEIRKWNSSESQIILAESFETHEALEKYLEAHTLFRIGDFVAR